MASAKYTIDLNTAGEFLDYLRPSRPHWGTHIQGKLRWVFRGQGNAAWSLLPSAWRSDEGSLSTIRHLSSSIGPQSLVPFLHRLESCPYEVPDGVAKVNTQSAVELRMLQEFLAHANEARISLPYSSLEIRPEDFGFVADHRNSAHNDCYPDFRHLKNPFFDVALAAQKLDLSGLESDEMDQDVRNWISAVGEAWTHLTNFTMRNSVAALAQHHGIPTRLLDWTRDSRTAAHFACSCVNEQNLGSTEDRIAVFALNPHLLLHERLTGDELGRFEEDPEAAAVFLSRHSTFLEKSDTTSYLAAQAGLFTYPEFSDLYRILVGEYPTLDKSIELQVTWRQKHRNYEPHPIQDYIRKITLPFAEVDSLMEMLDDERIFVASLMPNLDRLKESIIARAKRSSRLRR